MAALKYTILPLVTSSGSSKLTYTFAQNQHDIPTQVHPKVWQAVLICIIKLITLMHLLLNSWPLLLLFRKFLQRVKLYAPGFLCTTDYQTAQVTFSTNDLRVNVRWNSMHSCLYNKLFPRITDDRLYLVLRKWNLERVKSESFGTCLVIQCLRLCFQAGDTGSLTGQELRSYMPGPKKLESILLWEW